MNYVLKQVNVLWYLVVIMEIGTDALDFDFVYVDPQVQKTEVDSVYSQDLSEPLIPGSCILIKGTIRPQCKRFVYFYF